MALAGAATIAVASGVLMATAPSASAEPAGCSAQDYLDQTDILRPGRALCNGGAVLRMQENGDLVLRNASTGKACWHSGTSKRGVSVTFTPGKGSGPAGQFPPYLNIGDHQIAGSNNILDLGRTANLNSKGEFWIGYRAHRHLLISESGSHQPADPSMSPHETLRFAPRFAGTPSIRYDTPPFDRLRTGFTAADVTGRRGCGWGSGRVSGRRGMMADMSETSTAPTRTAEQLAATIRAVAGPEADPGPTRSGRSRSWSTTAGGCWSCRRPAGASRRLLGRHRGAAAR